MSPPQYIILLTIDALRADHLSYHGYESKTSPNLDAFSRRAVTFRAAYSASSHTREALPALLSGREPHLFSNRGYELVERTIAGYLDEIGFSTGAFHSNPYASRAYGYHRDFDEFHDDLYLGNHRLVAFVQRGLDKLRNKHYARAKTINKRSLRWIDSRSDDERLFLWNHYMDPHGPYDPPEVYVPANAPDKKGRQSLFRHAVSKPDTISEEERQILLDLYDAEIQYIDDKLGAFLEELESRGILGDALVVVTADHGEAFGECGYFSHPRQLCDELLHVPLLLYGPTFEPTTYKTPVSTLDIVPTILNKFGQDVEDFPGEPLLNRVTGEKDGVVFSQVRGEDNLRDRRLFSVTDGSDRYTINTKMDSDHPPSSSDDSHLARKLVRYCQTVGEANEPIEEREDIPKEVQDRIQALGYLEK